jgi:hypothetical protein
MCLKLLIGQNHIHIYLSWRTSTFSLKGSTLQLLFGELELPACLRGHY